MGDVFIFPKPTFLLKILNIGSDWDSICLDFLQVVDYWQAVLWQ
jgi:hypothetical protein